MAVGTRAGPVVADLHAPAEPLAPAGPDHPTVSHGRNRRSRRGRIVDAEMRPIDFEDGVQAAPGKSGAYPGVPEGGLEKLLTEVASVPIVVARLGVGHLVEEGLIPSASIVEVGSQDPAIANEDSISEPLLIEESIAVAVSKVDKEVDIARKNIGEGKGQVVVYP